MDNYVIAIPSHMRENVIAKKVLSLLGKHNIVKDKIYIFVEKSEMNAYKKELPEYQIIEGSNGIANQRQCISNYFPTDMRICSIDDDVEEIYEHDTPILNLDYFIKDTFTFLDSNKLTMAGVYPVANYYFCKPTITLDLRFCAGAFKCMINKKDLEERKFELLEDYENTLKHFIFSTGVVRYNYVYLKCNYNSGKGGLKQYRTKERKMEEVNKFYGQYKKYCAIKKDGDEIRLLKKPKE